MAEAPVKLRIDKWLWAARFFKTRALSADAVEGGKVTLSGVRVKPARNVAVGDTLEIRVGKVEYIVKILARSTRRGPATEAQKLYFETETGRLQREALLAELRAQPQPNFKGRPTKRERRKIENFKAEVKGDGGAWGF